MAIPERVDLFRVQVRRGKDRGNENNGKRRRSESGQVREKGGGCEGRDERGINRINRCLTSRPPSSFFPPNVNINLFI